MDPSILQLEGIGPVTVTENPPEIAELIGRYSIYRYGWGVSEVFFEDLDPLQQQAVRRHAVKYPDPANT